MTRRTMSSTLVLVAAGAALVVAMLISPPFTGLQPSAWGALVLGALVVMVGEVFGIQLSQRRRDAPVSTAAALALAMTVAYPSGADLGIGVGTVVVVVLIAALAGQTVARWRSDLPSLVRVAQLGVLTLVAAALFRGPWVGEDTLSEMVRAWGGEPVLLAVEMFVVAGLAAGVQLLLRIWLQVAAGPLGFRHVLVEEVRDTMGLAPTVVVTGVVVAVAVRTVGPVAIPLFVIPLALLQLAAQRQSHIRTAQHETIRAIAAFTDVGGFTTPGHAGRVADLAVAMARDLGLAERKVSDLEYAALLHDIGQVALRRPIPGGATAHVAPLDQVRIATTGSSVLARTAELSRLSRLVAEQATPAHQQDQLSRTPMASRLLRVANAFDDHTRGDPNAEVVRAAVERIVLASGYDYDERAVDALIRVLRRDGHLAATDDIPWGGVAATNPADGGRPG